VKYRYLGKSDLQVSEIGFGCMSLGQDKDFNEKLIHEAIHLGINFFDTADLYAKGQNEVMVGHALRDYRKDIVLATKVGNQWRKDGSGWDWNPGKKYILRCIEESLRRLGTDYIDLYQLHGGTIEDPIDDTIAAFETLKKQGKIRFYGISSIRPNVIREYLSRSTIVSVMMQYSLLDRRPEENCLALLKKKQTGVLARGSLAQGLLAGKPASPYLGHGEKVVRAAALAVESACRPGRDRTATALQFVLREPAVASAIVGIRTMDQLRGAVLTSGAPSLTDSEYESLRLAAPALPYDKHR
jgi:aryl-alcohol dehydrogenase-like predicted oxidoreductase